MDRSKSENMEKNINNFKTFIWTNLVYRNIFRLGHKMGACQQKKTNGDHLKPPLQKVGSF